MNARTRAKKRKTVMISSNLNDDVLSLMTANLDRALFYHTGNNYNAANIRRWERMAIMKSNGQLIGQVRHNPKQKLPMQGSHLRKQKLHLPKQRSRLPKEILHPPKKRKEPPK